MGKNSYLQPLVTPLSTKSDVTPQLVGTTFRKLAVAFSSNMRRKEKRDHEKKAGTRTGSLW